MRGTSVNFTVMDKKILMFYTLLFVMQIVLSKPNIVISSPSRIMFILAVLLPLFVNMKYFPFVLISFSGISGLSFSPILPTKGFWLLAVAIFSLLFIKSLKFRHSFLFFVFYCIIINLMHGQLDIAVFASILTVILSTIHIKNQQSVDLMSIAFMIVSLVLSLLYLFYKNDFATFYIESMAIERYGWINPNVLGGCIGIGVVLSVMRLLKISGFIVNKLMICVAVVTIVLSFMTLVILASRGALVATCISIGILIFTSKVQARYKLLLGILIVVMGIILWKNGYFTLLEVRMNEDSLDSGGGRLAIWVLKLSCFFNDMCFWENLFGIGQENCINIGTYISTHNDFITAIIAFGIIGFIIFCWLLLQPLILARGKSKTIVYILWLYLVIECCVLEPVFRGYIVLLMYYVFIYKYAQFLKN